MRQSATATRRFGSRIASTFAKTNQVLTTYRLQLQLRSQVGGWSSELGCDAGQVLTLLDNFDEDALGTWRTAGRVRSTWARSSSSRIAGS
jgi:hypothetical protein